jgi:hypothetical protein
MYFFMQKNWALPREYVWSFILVFSLYSFSLFVNSIATKITGTGIFIFEKEYDGKLYLFVTSFWLVLFIVGIILTIFEIKGLIPPWKT